jgi:hypothetical protein
MSPVATTLSAPAGGYTAPSPIDKKLARRTKFEGAWGVIRDELLEHFGKEGMPKEATEWYQKVSCGCLSAVAQGWSRTALRHSNGVLMLFFLDIYLTLINPRF